MTGYKNYHEEVKRDRERLMAGYKNYSEEVQKDYEKLKQQFSDREPTIDEEIKERLLRVLCHNTNSGLRDSGVTEEAEGKGAGSFLEQALPLCAEIDRSMGTFAERLEEKPRTSRAL